MDGKHRSHLQLQMDILETIAVVRDDPHLLTQISYKTEMNSEQIARYLVEMALKGLLTVQLTAHARIARKEYKITDNGRILLNLWVQFKKTWEMLTEKKPVSKIPSKQP